MWDATLVSFELLIMRLIIEPSGGIAPSLEGMARMSGATLGKVTGSVRSLMASGLVRRGPISPMRAENGYFCTPLGEKAVQRAVSLLQNMDRSSR